MGYGHPIRGQLVYYLPIRGMLYTPPTARRGGRGRSRVSNARPPEERHGRRTPPMLHRVEMRKAHGVERIRRRRRLT